MEYRKRKISILSIFATVVIVVILIIFSFKIIYGFRASFKALDASLSITYQLSTDDSSLLLNIFNERFKVLGVYNTEQRNSISLVTIQDNQYVLLHNLKTNSENELSQYLEIEYGTTGVSNDYSYEELGAVPYSLKWRGEPEPIASKIFLKIKGISEGNISYSDSVVTFSFIPEEFSIKYTKGGPVELVGYDKGPLNNSKLFRIKMIIIKRANNLKLLLAFNPIE